MKFISGFQSSVLVTLVCHLLLLVNYDLARKKAKEIALEKLEQLLRYIPVIMPTQEAAEKYAIIRSFLEKAGQPIGNNDLWIAAHALSLNTVLVINNTNEFIKVPDLLFENWAISV